jgi:catechol-2,3-dioxygenase
MNTDVIIHPKLHHYGLTTTNLDTMTDWYRKVLGMTVNHRSSRPADGTHRAPFSAVAFLGNDEADHRMVLFEMPENSADAHRGRAGPLQHVAFQCETFDDLLGTYERLKSLNILPLWAADHGVATAIYYEDPDRNVVEINVNNYGNAWTATEHMKTMSPVTVQVDPGKMIAARGAGAAPWELHQRAIAGEFIPAKPFDARTRL